MELKHSSESVSIKQIFSIHKICMFLQIGSLTSKRNEYFFPMLLVSKIFSYILEILFITVIPKSLWITWLWELQVWRNPTYGETDPQKKETWSNCSQVLQCLEVQYLQVMFATRLGWVSSRIWKRTQQLSLFIKCSNRHLGLPLPSPSGSPVARCSFHQTEPLRPISCDTSGCLIYSFLHINSCDCLYGCSGRAIWIGDSRRITSATLNTYVDTLIQN